MLRKTITHAGGDPVILVDSITKVEPGDADAIVVSASHGGQSSGEFALIVPFTAVFFNDAGIGKDEAGIAGLAMLDGRTSHPARSATRAGASAMRSTCGNTASCRG